MKYLVLLIGLLASSVALAERDYGLYVGTGGGLMYVDAKDAFQGEVDFKVGEVFGGAYWRWFGVEVRQGLSLNDETIYLGNDPDTNALIYAKTSVDSYTSTYLRIQFQNRVARIYGLLGTTSIDTTSDYSSGGTVQASSSGNSYGIGGGIKINEHLSFNLESRVLMSNELDTFTMSNFNIDFRF